MFTRIDLIEYSNWVINWCVENKYRKTIDGAKPYGSGEPKTDDELFSMWESKRIVKVTSTYYDRCGEYGC